MADDAPHPAGGIDYPRTLKEFDEWFPTEPRARILFGVSGGLMVSGARRGRNPGAGTGRIRMARVDDVSVGSLVPFVQTSVSPGATIRTDGLSAYSGLAKGGYDHQPKSISASGDPAHVVMPRVHRAAALLDRWWLGIHHGAIDASHLDYYLEEFTFRFNRRRSQARGLLFFRMVQQAVQREPAPYQALVGGEPHLARKI